MHTMVERFSPELCHSNRVLVKQVTTPMLRALGNICTGPSEYSVMVCENARLMPALMKLLECPISHIVKEAVWVISNMTCKYLGGVWLSCG